MGRLAQREATLEFLLLAAEEDGTRPFPEHVVAALLDVVPSDTVAYRAWSCENGILDRSFAANDVAERSRAWLSYPLLRRDDPYPSELPGQSGGVPSVSAPSLIGTSLVLSDAVAARRLRQTGLYYELMRPFGVRDVLKLFLPSDDGTGSAFVFDTSGRGFTNDDRALLRRLVPILVQFRRNARLRSVQARTLALLTPRELVVLGRAAEGETNAEIAAALCIGESTVRKHLEHIYEKLQVRNRAAAAVAYTETRQAGVLGSQAR
jgi:DNA-binding CsgD family transcriptional regulator